MTKVRKLPAVALRGMTILPDVVIHFDLSRKKSINAAEQALNGTGEVFLVTQLDPEENEPGYDEVYHVGTVAKVKQINKMQNGIVRVLVEGISRAELISFSEDEVNYLL